MLLIRMLNLICLICVNLSQVAWGSKEDEGYPQGYLPDCNGSTKPSRILPSHLRYISISTLSSGDVLTSRLTRYTYHQTHLLAKDKSTDFTKKTILYVSGYLINPPILSMSIGSVYKRLGYNVWSVDMTEFITYPYPVSVRLIRPVCTHVAEMLANLTKFGLDPTKLELVGISLGGHAISFIAKSFRNLTGLKLSRLTGLDPAGPCFRNLGPEDRLDKSDADFVDVLHTNIDGFGMAAAMGHVDFYINGGEYQPGDIIEYYCTNTCSHIRSYTIWLAALLNQHSFIGVQCASVKDARERSCFDKEPLTTNLLGLKTDRHKPGIYYLATNATFPYFIGKKGLKKGYSILTTVLSSLNEKDLLEA